VNVHLAIDLLESN